MATIKFSEKAKLSVVEAQAIQAHVRSWFKSHPEHKSVIVRLGVFGDISFKRTTFARKIKEYL